MRTIDIAGNGGAGFRFGIPGEAKEKKTEKDMKTEIHTGAAPRQAQPGKTELPQSLEDQIVALREEQRQNMKAMAAMLSEMRSTLGTLKKEMADTAKKEDTASKSDLSAAVAEVEKGLKQLEPYIHRELGEAVGALAGEMGRTQGELTDEIRKNTKNLASRMQQLAQQIVDHTAAKTAESEKNLRWRVDEFETNMNNKFGY